MKTFKQMYNTIKFKLIGTLIKRYGSIKFTPWVGRNDKGERELFEKDVLKLLQKYKVIDSTTGIQQINIILNAYKYPKIEIMKYIYNEKMEQLNEK